MSYEPFCSHMLGVLIGANMNSTADQAIPIGSAKYVIDKIIVVNASVSLSVAAGGFYTATSKGGTAVVAAAQVYSGLTGSTKVVNPVIAVTDKRTETTLYLSLTAAQGAPATADVYIIGTSII